MAVSTAHSVFHGVLRRFPDITDIGNCVLAVVLLLCGPTRYGDDGSVMCVWALFQESSSDRGGELIE